MSFLYYFHVQSHLLSALRFSRSAQNTNELKSPNGPADYPFPFTSLFKQEQVENNVLLGKHIGQLTCSFSRPPLAEQMKRGTSCPSLYFSNDHQVKGFYQISLYVAQYLAYR